MVLSLAGRAGEGRRTSPDQCTQRTLMAKKELASSIAPRYTVNGQPRFTWPGPLEVVSRCICRTLVSNLKCEEKSPLLWLISFGKIKV